MRPPVGKNWDEYRSKWYIADVFGTHRGSYYHNGIDLNLTSGGDSDLGESLYAVLPGEISYYHYNSHPDKVPSYGRHLVIRVKTPRGVRWCHYAHCDHSPFLEGVQPVKEGQKVAEVGKSGTNVAHLHFAVFTVDPKTLPNGIDTIAKTQQQLDDWWEDPEVFLANQEDDMGDQYGDLVYKSTQHDLTVAYLFGDERDPRQTPSEDIQSHIAGLKSRGTDLQNKLIATEKELSNKTEQVSRLNEQLTEQAKLHSAEITALKKQLKPSEELERLYKGRVEALQLQIEGLAREKGELNRKIGELEAEITRLNNLVNNRDVLSNSTTSDIIRELINRIWR